MSFLFPLFFAAAAAIIAPILLHLLRQRARNVQAFSSLMFLRPTPPRMQPKTRVENLLLLLLRCLALILLAVAFARPLWNTTDIITAGQNGRTVVLIDTSASMNRTGLWDQAQERVSKAIKDAGPNQRVAIIAFDRSLRQIVSFEDWASKPSAARADYSKLLIKNTKPSNAGTDLGVALTGAIELISEDETAAQEAKGPKRIILISDMQSGRRLDALRNTTWPEGLDLSIEQVTTTLLTNAGMALVATDPGLAPETDDLRPRVRITNDAKSSGQSFEIAWADGLGATTSVNVPPGNTRVARAPARPPGQPGFELVLRGDDHGFDNTLAIAADAPAVAPVLYLGDDHIDDPNGLAYFLKHALQPTRSLAPQLITDRNIKNLTEFSWVVVGGSPTPALFEPLKNYLTAGGAITAVLRQPADATWIGTVSGHTMAIEEAKLTGFALMGRVDFEHPLLRPFDVARFGDFTKIHYWHYRKVTPPADAKVLAWYDDGQPAWFELAVGQGRILVMTSGWHPADSQLALSTKFGPLIYTELQRSGNIIPRLTQVIIGEPSTMPTDVSSVVGPINPAIAEPRKNAADTTAKPSGQTAPFLFDKQGLYRLQTTNGTMMVAANIDPAESLTAPLALETLEAMGVKISKTITTATEAARTSEATLTAQRLLKVAEIEERQKSWVWILAAVLVVLVIETLVAGKATGASKTTGANQTTESTIPPQFVSTGASS